MCVCVCVCVCVIEIGTDCGGITKEEWNATRPCPLQEMLQSSFQPQQELLKGIILTVVFSAVNPHV